MARGPPSGSTFMPLPPRYEILRHPAVAAALLASLLLRGGLMAVGPGAFADRDNYLPLARSVAAGHGLLLGGRPTAYRPPLYPILLAPIVAILGSKASAGIGVFHCLLGALTVAATALAAQGWGLRSGRVVAAAWITALDPALAWQSRFIMTETLTACLAALALAVLCRPGWKGWLLGGLVLGLSALARPSMLPGAALVIAASAVAAGGGLSTRLVRAASLALGLVLVLLPWALRNACLFGEPVWTTTHGGYTLALANNEVYFRDVVNGPPGSVWTGHDQWLWWDSVNRETAGMPEPQADRFERDRAIAVAMAHPGTFLRASLGRLGRFWSLAPAMSVYERPVRWATLAWTLPLWLALGLGLIQRSVWKWPQIAAPLLIAGLTMVHAVYWTDLRMRAPIVPAIALLAASAERPARLRRHRD